MNGYSTLLWLQKFLLSKFTCRPVDSTSTRHCSGYSTVTRLCSETSELRNCRQTRLLDFYSTSTRLCSIGQKCETVAKNGYSTGEPIIPEKNSTRQVIGSMLNFLLNNYYI